jgi:Zn-dependent protease
MRRLTGFPVADIRGIQIEVHWTLPLIFAWSANAFLIGFLPALYPGHSTYAYFAMALLASLGLVGSILLHELGHARQARREGWRADRVILYYLGGLAFIAGRHWTRGKDLRVTLAGPAVSAILAGVFSLSGWLVEAAGGTELAYGLLLVLGATNAILVAFNLLPAFPLDGGQVVRALLIGRASAERVEAIVWRLSLATGALLILVGVVGPFLGLLPAIFSFTSDDYDTAVVGFSGLGFVMTGGLTLVLTSTVGKAAIAMPGPREPLVADLVRAANQSAAERTAGHPADEVVVNRENAVELETELSLQEAWEKLDGTPGADGLVVDNGKVVAIVPRSVLATALLETRDGTG